MLQVELKVIDGRQQGKLIPLNVRQFLIGREQDCHLRPNSDLVSRHHCVFTIDDFTVRIRDLGSTNGTFVNGERIQGQVVLQPGDHVVVGKLSFEVVVRQAAGEKSPSPEPAVSENTVAKASSETSLNISDTIEIPSQPLGDDTTVLPSFPTGDSAILPATMQQAYMPQPGYGVPQYGMPQGYPPAGYAPQGYMPGFVQPGYAMPAGYMPGNAYGMPQMMPGMPAGYGVPQMPGGAASQGVVTPEMPEVVLPDPETTGAKPVAPPPPAPPPEAGDPAAPPAAQAKKPSDAAADIIRMHRLRRP